MPYRFWWTTAMKWCSVPCKVSFKDIIEYGGRRLCGDRRSRQLPADAGNDQRQITPRTRAIIINTPNNPSGAVLNRRISGDPAAGAQARHLCDRRPMLRLPEFHAAAVSAGSITDVKQHLVIIGSLSRPTP
jgi:hypothetical protein